MFADRVYKKQMGIHELPAIWLADVICLLFLNLFVLLQQKQRSRFWEFEFKIVCYWSNDLDWISKTWVTVDLLPQKPGIAWRRKRSQRRMYVLICV